MAKSSADGRQAHETEANEGEHYEIHLMIVPGLEKLGQQEVERMRNMGFDQETEEAVKKHLTKYKQEWFQHKKEEKKAAKEGEEDEGDEHAAAE